MSKAKYDVAPQFVKAEERRQRYLDYFHANPGHTAPELRQYMIATFGEDGQTSNTLGQMMTLGEIYNIKTGRVYRYYPIAKQTTKAEVFSAKQRDAARKNMCFRNGVAYERPEEDGEPKGNKSPHEGQPYYYRHKPTHTHNSGGQGALRERVHVGAIGMAI